MIPTFRHSDIRGHLSSFLLAFGVPLPQGTSVECIQRKKTDAGEDEEDPSQLSRRSFKSPWLSFSTPSIISVCTHHSPSCSIPLVLETIGFRD
ncbi:hypothetical protein TNCV_485741 [Trichonephila clavipes]|nr:hypothetical protein TNCV_485741 [Trichonephila clavipes]